MSKVILICGKICSGKTYYANQIRKQENAVILSTDEMTYDLIDNEQREKYDILVKRVRGYLLKKTVELAGAGCNVILDWGFWTRGEREAVTAFLKAGAAETEWHYIDITDEAWHRNIRRRNQKVLAGEGGSDFYVDEGLFRKVSSRFEVPLKSEIHVWHRPGGESAGESEEVKMTEREKAQAGYMFVAGDPTLRQERDRAKDLCFELNLCRPSDQEKRMAILRSLIGSIKGNFNITSPFYCDYGRYITIGNNFFSNYDCKIIDGGRVTFGDDVRIGPNCTFATANHAPDPQMRKEGHMIYQPITVGNNVWFGAGVTVLPGVSIGDDTIIGAGSVVTRDIPAGVFAAGCPCKVIRPIGEKDKEKYPVWSG